MLTAPSGLLTCVADHIDWQLFFFEKDIDWQLFARFRCVCDGFRAVPDVFTPWKLQSKRDGDHQRGGPPAVCRPRGGRRAVLRR